ncbi:MULTISPECIES: Ldh family oxidoreductase [Pseudomonas]|uniref:Ldh family oxidoreductase n=1 Tax=Pseudomonas sessilinigenes TaxID=658629 RepID=A0ABX8MPN0_9PSED|nr:MULTISPECIES: Ldh family oxidoreductase [Pseudomonas]AZC26896.1 Ureidoglycolate/malate/sulfolactate dehydrogenase family [Pseudomonas sessilinigenes]QXH39136.1 Ldh family oxidoreductase [Pseudomonas sessilinigenes]UMZ09317.1 Ldh family oxidoreductase [Pseudomonas sp. MPFS]
MSDLINLSLDQAFRLSNDVLANNGFCAAHAQAIARTITRGQADECHSHGLYRLLVCVKSMREGQVDPQALPTVTERSAAIVAADAHRAYSLLAFQTALPLLVQKARQVGVAAMVINNCFHFSALWPEIEAVTEHGLAALALTPSHSWVAPAGGSKPVFGTNPIAFGWPRVGHNPFVFDFATSAIARGDIELHRRANRPLPEHCAVDDQGQPTTDALAAMSGAMLTFGGHKGSALAAMVELLAGALINDMTSMESMAFDNGVGATPLHGELILAFDPQLFANGNAEEGARRAEEMFAAIVDQGARLPSQRRYDARRRSEEQGVFIPRALYEDILKLLDK